MKKVLFALAVSVLLFTHATTHGQSSAIPWSVFGSGSALQSGGGNSVRGVVGQSIAGRSSGAGNVVSSGFLPGALALGGGTTDIPLPGEEVPHEFALLQNYPNPFNPSTKIVYRLKSREAVELSVYDVLGREVVTVINEVQDPGEYSISFDTNLPGKGSTLASGVHIYRLRAGQFVSTKKMMLVR